MSVFLQYTAYRPNPDSEQKTNAIFVNGNQKLPHLQILSWFWVIPRLFCLPLKQNTAKRSKMWVDLFVFKHKNTLGGQSFERSHSIFLVQKIGAYWNALLQLKRYVYHKEVKEHPCFWSKHVIGLLISFLFCILYGFFRNQYNVKNETNNKYNILNKIILNEK